MKTVHVKCLYNIHKRSPPLIDNEPRYGDVRQLLDFKVEALYARMSILQFLGILKKGPSSFAEPGHETSDLGILDDDLETTVVADMDMLDGARGKSLYLVHTNHF
jgi:hypothetical protein